MHDVETLQIERLGALESSAPPTRPQRRELLRALLRGRGLERRLVSSGAGPAADDENAVLGAIAAASGLEQGDRLVASHRFLSAHLALGESLEAVASARRGIGSGELRPAIAAQSAPAVALGAALALRTTRTGSVAVALADRRWAGSQEWTAALALAREHQVAVVIVAIHEGPVHPAGDDPRTTIDRNDFEGVRAAVRLASETAQASNGPVLIAISPRVPEAPRRFAAPSSATSAARLLDPLAAYERLLLINGFSREDLDAIRREAAGELGKSR